MDKINFQGREGSYLLCSSQMVLQGELEDTSMTETLYELDCPIYSKMKHYTEMHNKYKVFTHGANPEDQEDPGTNEATVL